jgi:hypothetical protein
LEEIMDVVDAAMRPAAERKTEARAIWVTAADDYGDALLAFIGQAVQATFPTATYIDVRPGDVAGSMTLIRVVGNGRCLAAAGDGLLDPSIRLADLIGLESALLDELHDLAVIDPSLLENELTSLLVVQP